MNTNTTLGEFIQQQETRRGITSKELADKVGCSVATMCAIELGYQRVEPNSEFMVKLSKALEISNNALQALPQPTQKFPSKPYKEKLIDNVATYLTLVMNLSDEKQDEVLEYVRNYVRNMVKDD